MKITILPSELEAGKRLQVIGEKRARRLREHLSHVGPFRIDPTDLNGDSVSLIWIDSIKPVPDGKTELAFRPLRQTAYQVIHARQQILTHLTVQFPDEQVTFSSTGFEKTKHRLTGPGCDPSVNPDPETLLAKLVKTEPQHPVVSSCLTYIRRKFQNGQ